MCNLLIVNRSIYYFLTICVFFIMGCSHPIVHKELWDDPAILRKTWTMASHGVFEAGDHGTENSNPLIIKNTLYFGNQSTGLTAMYIKERKVRWKLAIKGGVISELIHDNDCIYFGGADGLLYSVQQETGHVNWTYSLRNSIVSRPTLHNGRIFVLTSDDTLYSLDANSGEKIWFYKRRSHPVSKIYGASQPLINGNEVIVGLSDGFLVSLSFEEGQLKREKKLHFGTKFTDIIAQPILNQDVIYIPSYDGALYALRQDNWDTIWKLDVGGSRRVEIEDNTLYFPSSDGAIYSIQKKTSRLNWKFQLDYGTPTQLIRTDKYIIFGSSQDYLYVLDKNTGKALYRYNVGSGSGFSGSPAYAPDSKNIYFLSASGNLNAFKIKDPLPIKNFGRTKPYTFTPKI